jgi:hypothetical protein
MADNVLGHEKAILQRCPDVWPVPTNDSRRRNARQYRIPIPPQLDLPISYNIAPSQNVLAIQVNPERQEWSLAALR